MTLLWVGAGVLTVFTVLMLIQPILRRPRPLVSRGAYDAAVLTDQLAEIDRDEAAGQIDAEAAAAARRELKRRLLAAIESTRGSPAEQSANVSGKASKKKAPVAIVLALAVPALAVFVYLNLGNPEKPDQPLAARLSTGDLAEAKHQPAADQSLTATVAQLESYLASRPDEGQGWFLLGRAYLTLERKAD
ncbi:MAG: c-type cytochrome biogenesis protein CcmI, partial [Rhodospirillales bacterium]|nr:c-type cytochrome biogenesis protein CcmI [Rhodospirillales bacterium]